jgi:hypothetical protein
MQEWQELQVWLQDQIYFFAFSWILLATFSVDCIWNVMARAETRFRLSAKRINPFKSAGASVQSTTGSRGMPISGSNVGYTMIRSSVKSTGYPLHSPVSPSLPLPRHRVPSHFNWTLPLYAYDVYSVSLPVYSDAMPLFSVVLCSFIYKKN